MAPEPRKEGLSGHAKQAGQFGSDILHHRGVVVLKQIRLQTAANERAQQYVAFRRSAGIFQAAESTGHNFALFDGRNDEAKAIELAWKVLLPERETDRCRGGVGDLLQVVGSAGSDAAEQPGGLERRCCENDSVSFIGFRLRQW